MTPIKDAATSPSDDLIAFAITEAFGERCPTADADCYTCQAWDQYDKLNALTTPAPGRDELRERIARIIDPTAFEKWDNAQGSWRKDEAKAACWDAEEKADAILSALPVASVVDEADRPYCDPVKQGEAFYLAMYAKDGAIWSANEHQDIWINLARDYERRRRAAIRAAGGER